MTEYGHMDLVVTGDPAKAKAMVIQEFTERRFRMTWTDEWTAVAERGSKVANFLAGAFAQYFKVGVHVFSSNEGQSIVRLERLSSGVMGGAIGSVRTKRNMDRLHGELERAFADAGVLVKPQAA